MNSFFYENVNKASYDLPFIQFEAYNLTSFSHFHGEIEVAYLAEGEATVIFDNKKITAHQGDMFVFMPGQIHGYIHEGENRFYIFKLRCTNEYDPTDFTQMRAVNSPLSRDENLYSVLLEKIEECRKEYYTKPIGYPYILNGLSNVMVADILRFGNLYYPDKKETKKNQIDVALLSKVNAYIEAHFSEKISLNDVAEFCGISEFYFAHSFKDITGTTFFEYLSAFRLEKAVYLITNKNKSIADAAYECGFSSSRYFYKVFNKQFSISPKVYLEKIRNSAKSDK